MKGRLFLIDGSSFCYRAFYAVRELTTSRGQPTNAIFGVVTMLRKLMEEERPEYLAVAFDLPEPTFRHERYEAYKEHRLPMPEGLVSQLPWIKEVLKAHRIPIFEEAGFEADDLLGTLAQRAEKKGLEVMLVTGDKDALQLLSGKIKVYRPTREGHEIIDTDSLRLKWNLRPDQVVELMSLMGDATDNIPGVSGIGEKTALQLIGQFQSVGELLKHLEEVRPSVAAKIREHKEQLELSRELATIDTQVPLKIDWQALKAQEPDLPALRRLFQELEFRSLARDLPGEAPAGRCPEVRTISGEELPGVLPEILEAQTAAVVVGETGAALSWREGSAAVLEGEEALSMLAPFWTNPRVKKICPGLKETLLLLRRAGTELQGPRTDPSLASYLLNPGRASHGVEDLSEEFLGESVSGRDPLHSLGLEAQAAFRLAPLLEAEVRKRELLPLLEEVEIPLSEVLAKMEFAGIRVDPGELEALSNLMKGELLRLTREIHRLAGEEFNINSPRQLGPILFEKLKLPVVKRTKTGASTDEEVLRRLSKRHPLPGMILEYREMYKLRSTYVEALPKLIDPTTGRIHTSFNQTVTATGRLSSSDPNLQNIPIRTPLGRQIRKAFVPSDPGKAFLAADYSQIELRILAHLSEDEALTAAFQAAQDIHRVTAAEVFHLPEEKVDGAQRSAAKAINFGIVYGMTPFGLAKELGVDPPEAQEFIERYFSRYPGVKRYLDRVLEQAREKGYCTTLLQRRRYIPELHSKDLAVRQFAERTALNAPIQGSAADLIKLAMVSIDRKITEEGLESRMLLQVHDELIFEVPRGELEEISAFVRQAMESPSFRGEKLSFRVPIEVKLTAGSNWLEASHG